MGYFFYMQRLPKKERLHGETIIHQLFDKSKRFTVYPLRIHYIPRPTQEKSRIVISIPKRLFKHAVDRNLLKRRIREAYRLNKPTLSVDMAIVYISSEIATFDTLQECIKRTVVQLNNRHKVEE